MPRTLFDYANVIKQRRSSEKEYGEELESIKGVFNFNLEELPVEEMCETTDWPGKVNPGLTLNLPNDRVITMTEVTQFTSQAGVLEGVQHPLSSFGNAIARAKTLFPHFRGVPKGLAPTLYCSPNTTSENDTWIAVPPVCTVAMFESSKPARTANADYSFAVFIWFQNNFGTTLDERTRQQIQSLLWSKFAADG